MSQVIHEHATSCNPRVGCTCTKCHCFECKKARAYRRGRDSLAERDAICPYSDGTPLADAWEEGREHAEEEMADEFAQFCDPSMRDLYE